MGWICDDFAIFLALRSGLSCHCSTRIFAFHTSGRAVTTWSTRQLQQRRRRWEERWSWSGWQGVSCGRTRWDGCLPGLTNHQPSSGFNLSYLILLHSERVKLEMENDPFESTPTVSQAMCSIKEHVISIHHTPYISIKGNLLKARSISVKKASKRIRESIT